MTQLTKERFLSEVAEHELTIHLDSGNHRHITLSKPKSSNRHFHIVTWPGYLAITGDMGSYTFARLTDMFEFFRSDDPNDFNRGINLDYWSEKLQAVDKYSAGFEDFSWEKALDCIKRDFEQWEYCWEDAPEGLKEKAWKLLEDEFYWWEGRSQESVVDNIQGYKCPLTGNTFMDFWDHNLRDYTHHFVWCCYAIQWAIEQYDKEVANGQ